MRTAAPKPKPLLTSSLALTLLLGSSLLYHSEQTAYAATDQGTLNLKHQLERHSAQTGKFHPPHQRHRQHDDDKHPLFKEAASLLGLDEKALLAALHRGNSLSELAQQKGISEAELTQKLRDQRIARLDEAVQSGKLDAEKAAQITQRLDEHITRMITRKDWDKPQHRLHALRRHLQPTPEKMATILGLSKEQLMEQLQSGKTLEEIAEIQGISRKKLIEKIKDSMTPMIEKWISHSHGHDHAHGHGPAAEQ